MKVPEENRVTTGRFASTEEDGNNGLFAIKKGKLKFSVIASDGMGWEHVSATIINAQRCPTWREMCFIKDLFFNEDEVVVQYHPAKKDYINNHPYCLHLWKKVDSEFETPPTLMVGI